MITIQNKISSVCDHIILWVLILLTFSVPLFFLPFTPQLTEFSKQVLFFVTVLIGYLAWFGKGILNKKLIIKRTPLDIPILAFLIVYGLATIFSVDRVTSILGAYGQGATGLVSVIFYALLYFIIVSNVNSRKKVLRLCISLLISTTILIVFVFLQIFNIFILPFEFAKNISFNPVGSFSSLVTFLAFVLSIAAAFLLKPKMNIVFRILILILVLAALILLNTINFKIAWHILILSMFIILSFGIAKEKEYINKGWLIVPAAILVIAIFATTLGIPSIIKGKIPSEVSLSFKLSLETTRHTLWHGFFNFLFGSGPETFGYDFSSFRPASFNQNIIWNVRFDKANNTYLELLATSGALGALTYIVILLIFIGSSSLLLIKSRREYLFGINNKPQKTTLPPHQSLLKSRFALFHKSATLNPPPEKIIDSGNTNKQRTETTTPTPIELPNIEREAALPATEEPRNININLKTGRKIFPPPSSKGVVDLKTRTIKEDEEEEEEEEIARPEPHADFIILGIVGAWAALLLANFLNFANTTLQISFWLSMGLIMALITIYRPQEFKKTKLSFKTSPKYALFLSFIFVLALCMVTVLFTYLGRIYLADVYHQQGLEKIAAEKYSEATGLFNRAVTLNKYRPIYYLALAQNYLTQANLEAAKGEAADINQIQTLVANSINESKLATDLSPSDVNLWEARGQIYENTTLYSRNANEWVIKSYEKALELEPTNPTFLAKLGRAYMVSASTAEGEEQENNYNQALEAFKKAVELKPDYLAAHYYLALIYENKKQFDEALEQIGAAYQIAPQNQDIIYELGRVSYNKAMVGDHNDLKNNLDFQRALDAFNLVVSQNANHANALYSLGLAYESLGEIGKALENIRRVQELNPDNEQIRQKVQDLESKL
ncbi:MAG: tetratricopeptide repeat protein [Patescibacteria group bacterium]|nr:tetratricopeptide repeat protein [Patescibacteria group bacterium]